MESTAGGVSHFSFAIIGDYGAALMKLFAPIVCAGVLLAVMSLTSQANSNVTAQDAPLQSRMVEWVDAGTFKFPVDQSPLWLHNKEWAGDERPVLFVAETPDKYYPPATFNAQHFVKEFVPENEQDSKYFFKGIIESVAKNYGFSGSHIKNINYVEKGVLQGYMVSLPGEIQGVSQDVIIYAAAAADKTVFVLTAFTLPGKAPHLQTTFDRVAINIEFVSADIKPYKN